MGVFLCECVRLFVCLCVRVFQTDSSICAYSVVLSVPPPTLQSLGVLKNEAMDLLTVIEETVLYFIYEEPWWRDSNNTIKMMVSDTPIHYLSDDGVYTEDNNTVSVLAINLNLHSYQDYWKPYYDGPPCRLCREGEYVASQSLYDIVQKHLQVFGVTEDIEPLAVYLHRKIKNSMGPKGYVWKAGHNWTDCCQGETMRNRVFVVGQELSGPPYQQQPIKGVLHSVDQLILKDKHKIIDQN